MDCPVCSNTKLMMAERQGIEIDYCPNCRGVWLDRGELDKVIEKSSADVVRQVAQPSQNDPYREQQHLDEFRQPQRPRGYSDDDYYYKKKRKGLLGELFDFD